MIDDEKIKKFLNDSMGKSEKEEFIQYLKENEQANEKLTEEVIRIYGRLKLREKLDNLFEKKQQTKLISLQQFFKIAAILLLFIGISFILYFNRNTPGKIAVESVADSINSEHVVAKIKKEIIDSAKIGTSHIASPDLIAGNNDIEIAHSREDLLIRSIDLYKPYPVVETRGEEYGLQKAFTHYRRSEYDSAILSFQGALKKSKSKDEINTALFYLGNCFFSKYIVSSKRSLILKSSEYFASVSMENNSVYQEPSNWYLALSYLLMEEDEKASRLLEKIVKQKDYNYLRAQEILSAMNN